MPRQPRHTAIIELVVTELNCGRRMPRSGRICVLSASWADTACARQAESPLLGSRNRAIHGGHLGLNQTMARPDV